jgi:hypothetical protein
MGSIAENEVFKDKLKALKQYEQFEKENTGAKQRYIEATKIRDAREFASSSLGRTSTGLIKTGKFIGKGINFLGSAGKIKSTSLGKPVNPGLILSKEQFMLNELFNGQRTFGTGNNLPKVTGALTTGQGLINHDDTYERRTGRMFGLK